AAREGTAGIEVPWPGVPAHHLRPGIHRAGASATVAWAWTVAEAVAGLARVRAGDRGAGAFRSSRAAATCPRVRLRRAGPGERAGCPAPVNMQVRPWRQVLNLPPRIE